MFKEIISVWKLEWIMNNKPKWVGKVLREWNEIEDV